MFRIPEHLCSPL